MFGCRNTFESDFFFNAYGTACMDLLIGSFLFPVRLNQDYSGFVIFFCFFLRFIILYRVGIRFLSFID